jgi:tetratricopeptide (TPR) repeat protein
MKSTTALSLEKLVLDQFRLSSHSLALKKSIKKTEDLIHHLFQLAVSCFDKRETKTARQLFSQAFEIEKIFHQQTNRQHPLLLETMQYLGKIYLKLDCPLKAKSMLLDTYRTQVSHFQTQTHPDIANTLQLLGDVYMKMEKFKLALDRYKQSLAIKMHFFTEKSETTILTQQAAMLAEKKWKNAIQTDLSLMMKLLPPPSVKPLSTQKSHQRRFSV